MEVDDMDMSVSLGNIFHYSIADVLKVKRVRIKKYDDELKSS